MERKKKIARGVGALAAVTVIILIIKSVRAGPPLEPADVVLSNLEIVPAEVFIGGQVTIKVTASNIGDAAGSYEVICEVV